MSKDIEKAQNGVEIPTNLINEIDLQEQLSGYEPPRLGAPLPSIAYQDPIRNSQISPNLSENNVSKTPELDKLLNPTFNKNNKGKGSGSANLSEFDGAERFNSFMTGGFDNETVAANNQGFVEKLVYATTKGSVLAGTTFLQGTIGIGNGIVEWIKTGEFASFYDNDFTRGLDKINKDLEIALPAYYDKVERDAKWYSSDYLLTGNFLTDGIIKNLGFAVGAVATGNVANATLNGFSKVPRIAKLLSVGEISKAMSLSENVAGQSVELLKDGATMINHAQNLIAKKSILDKGRRAFISGWGTSGEASIQSLMEKTEFKNKLIEEYKSIYGLAPSGEELQAIEDASNEHGATAFVLNTLLLTATQYIQLPTIMGSTYKGEKSLINDVAKEISDNVKLVDGKYVKVAPTMLQRVGKAITNPYVFAPSEAFEEVGQYAIGVGSADYYDKKYRDEDTDILESIGVGIGSMFTDEGAKNALLGGFSGAIMMAKGKFREARQKSKNTTEALKALNTSQFSDFTKETFEAVKRGVVIQEEREQQLKDGDVFGSKGSEADYIINYLTPRIKYGRFEFVKSDIDTQRELVSTQEGFDELMKEGKVAPSDTRQSYLQRLNNLEETANNIKTLYESLQLRYGNLVDAKGKPLYDSKAMDLMLYSAGKVADFEKRIPQLMSDLTSTGIDFISLSEGILSGNKQVYEDAVEQIKQLEVLDNTELLEKLKDYAKAIVARKQFYQDYNDVKNSPQKYKKEEPVRKNEKGETLDKDGNVVKKETLKIKTKGGEKEVVTNEEYRLIESVSYDDLEKETKSYKISITKVNDDGTVDVTFENGKTKTVSKEEFATWNLTRSETLKTDEKANYVFEHLNKIFEHAGIKVNGQYAKGKLKYSEKDKTLLFVYRDAKGVLKQREVLNTMFVAKGKYKQGMVRPIGETTSAQKVSQTRLEKAKLTMSERLAKRNEILESLVQETKNKLEQTVNKLEKSKNRLTTISSEIENAKLTKQGTVRKRIVGTVAKLIRELTGLQETLPSEIENLENEKSNLENQLLIMNDFLEGLYSMPEDSMEFVNQIKQDIQDLSEVTDIVKTSITDSEKQLGLVEELYKNAISLYNDLVKRLKEENPNVPTSIDDYTSRLEKYLGEEGAKYMIENKEGFTEIVLEIQEALNDFADEIQLKQLENKFNNLQNNISELIKGLEDVVAEQSVKNKIIEKFREAVIEQRAKEKEEEILKNNTLVEKQLQNSYDLQGESFTYAGDFEEISKKADNIIPRATVVPFTITKNHQKRANTFGFNLPKLKKQGKNIKAVYITKNNQDDLIPGLTKKLMIDDPKEKIENNKEVEDKPKKKIDEDQIIAMVMVTETSEGIKLVDVNGDVIPEGADKLNLAIYQTMPLGSLTNVYGSLFRNTTEQSVKDQITELYKQDRANILKSNTIEIPFDVEASFGMLQEVLDADGNRTFTKNSVTESGLIEESSLSRVPLIVIPTTQDEVGKNTTSYTKPFKRVLLNTDNGYTTLENDKHSTETAEVIYKSILQLANQLMTSEGMKSNISKRILRYLQGVTYWGIPTNQDGTEKENIGYSSVFFKKSKDGYQILYIGNKQTTFLLKPESLRANKNQIIKALEEVYSNTNNKMAQEISEKFEEILDISEDGEITSRVWQNYQTYLLSDTFPDGTKRTEIPLTTFAKPITKEALENRTNIYFYNTGNSERYEVEPVIKSTPLTFNNLATLTDEQMWNNLSAGIKNDLVKKFPKREERLAYVKANYQQLLTGKPVVEKIDAVTLGLEMIGKLFPEVRKVFEAKLASGEFTKEYFLEKAPAKIAQLKEQSINDLNNQFAEFEKQVNAQEGVEQSEKDAYIKTERVKLDAEITEIQAIDESVLIIPSERTIEDVPEIANTSSKVETQTDNNIKKPTLEEMKQIALKNKANRNNTQFREVAKERLNRFETENWKQAEQWLNKNFPNFSVYRLKNIIESSEGIKAWGMFQDAAIYVYENAEVGTIYHEVFEAVWKMFTNVNEQSEIINEFKTRKGTFVDRPSGKTVEYSKATNQQIKEQLAEEFRNYVLKKSIPSKGIKGFILNLFKDLVTFIRSIKNVFSPSDKSKIDNLFRKINTGGFKNPNIEKLQIFNVDSVVVKDYAEFSQIPGLTNKEKNDVIQEMIYQTLLKFVTEDANLFDSSKVANITSNELQNNIVSMIEDNEIDYSNLLSENPSDEEIENVAELIYLNRKLVTDIQNNWSEVLKLYKARISSFDITFDENDSAQINDENKTRNSDYVDATKVDNFKKMNSGLKLLLSTVVKVNENEKPIATSIGGSTLLSFNQVRKTLIEKLHTATSLDDMLLKFKKLADDNPDYRRLYQRFVRQSYTETPSFANIKTSQSFKLLSELWKTFSLQAPAVKTVFILENGEVEIGDTALSGAASQLVREYLNEITLISKSGAGFFQLVNDKYTVNTLKLNNFKLDKKNDNNQYVKFLKELGIDFSLSDISKMRGETLRVFKDSVNGLRMSINQSKDLAVFNKRSLDIGGPLKRLATIKAAITYPDFETTYFNVAGERTQSFIGGNAHSRLFKVIKSENVKNITDLYGTEYEYLITDEFAKGSVVLSKIFDSKTGELLPSNTEHSILEVGYSSGLVNEIKGKSKTSSSLNYRERLIQTLNLNLKGWFLNLIPGDSSTEWMTYLGNHVSVSDLQRVKKGEQVSMTEINEIFKNYFISELNMSRETDRQVHSSRNNKDLRFLKQFVSEKSQKEIIKLAENKDNYSEDIYEKYSAEINKNLLEVFTNRTLALQEKLQDLNIVNQDEVTGLFTSVGLNVSTEIGESALFTELFAIVANFTINNIEFHKLIYSDPYQYKDELKRIKSSNSPAQEILNSSSDANEAIDRIFNKKFKKGELGWTNFIRDYFRTVTYSDVVGMNKVLNYFGYEETDGQGIIGLKGVRNFRIRASNWSDANEAQYLYEVEFEKLHKAGKIKEAFALTNPKVKDTFTPQKPVVRGNKRNDKSYNDQVLDKYSLYPITYRIGLETNLQNLHDKLQNEDVDYMIFNTGRKVGAYTSFNPYTEKGKMNNNPYSDIINVRFSSISLQTEVPSKDSNNTTTGSQVTKLLTLDKMDAGVPIDYKTSLELPERIKSWYSLKTEDEKLEASDLYKEIKKNKDLLSALIDNGYKTMLNKLGIIETSEGWEIKDVTKAVNTLKSEMLKQEVDDNIIAALDGFLTENSVLESTPAYRQISNIIYSIVDKGIAHRKISGAMKVQISSTFWESERMAVETYTNEKGEEKQAYTSKNLKFYSKGENGTNVMEIMIGRWFKSDKTDDELLNEWYVLDKDGNRTTELTEEGRKILSGLGFRIPTQNSNSIDAFVIKKFLPEEFGDAVIVPAEITKKVGSDFDIDKLSMYLKNLFKIDGKLQAVPFYGIGENAISEFEKLFDSGKLLKGKQVNELKERLLKFNKGERSSNLIEEFVNLFGEIGVFTEEDVVEDFILELSEKGIKGTVVNKLYSQSLENAYIDSSIELVIHPQNFDKLTAPNDASQLKELSKKITKLKGINTNYTDINNFTDPLFMTELRHAFVAGKKAIGIAAVAQTYNVLNQQSLIYLNDVNIDNLSDEDRHWVRDASVNFENYNSLELDGKKRPVLSFIKNENGQNIADLHGQFIDGYVDISNGPWIMLLGATPNVASTWLTLIKMGVPIEDVTMFMNQPIILDYLQSLENQGYSWLFIEDYVQQIMNNDKYATNKTYTKNIIPQSKELEKLVGEKQLTQDERAEQHFYLREFLKYAKLSEQFFQVTQGSNYDTASFNNGYLLFKKQLQYEKARNTLFSSYISEGNSIPAVEAILNNSFIGNTKLNLTKAREAVSQILLSDAPNVRKVVQKVLLPYANKSDRDFIKITQSVVANLFDWAVQVDKKLNLQIQDILVNKGNVAQEMNDFVREAKNNPVLANNEVIKQFEIIPSDKAVGGTDNIKIKNVHNELIDKNNLIYAFQELKEYLNDNKKSNLYTRLVTLSILQSGLTSSTLSFTSNIPFEDFNKVYNETVSAINEMPNIEDFVNVNNFERNNWHNADLIPSENARFIRVKKSMYDSPYDDVGADGVVYTDGKKWAYNPAMKYLPKQLLSAISKGTIPQLMTVSTLGNNTQLNHIVYTWNKSEFKKEDIKKMKRKGDYSFQNKALFQKVYDEFNNPIIHTTPKGQKYFIYKAINAWGNRNRANEFYTYERQSVIDNGFLKINEVSDKKIADIYYGENLNVSTEIPSEANIVTTNKTLSMQPDNVAKILAGQKTTTLRTNNLPSGLYNVGNKVFNLVNRGLLSVSEAGGVTAITKSENFSSEGPKFEHTKEFLQGKRKLYVIDILPLENNNLSLPSENDADILNSQNFKKFAEFELSQNPNLEIEAILEYYKKCKNG